MVFDYTNHIVKFELNYNDLISFSSKICNLYFKPGLINNFFLGAFIIPNVAFLGSDVDFIDISVINNNCLGTITATNINIDNFRKNLTDIPDIDVVLVDKKICSDVIHLKCILDNGFFYNLNQGSCYIALILNV